MADEKKDWLIWDARSECWWGPNRGGYFKSLVDAGLYTEVEAKAAEASARRSSERMERARPLSEFTDDIERLYTALHKSPPLPEAVREQIERLRIFATDRMSSDSPAVLESMRQAADTIEHLAAAAQQERARPNARYTELQMQHARAQSNADGFQTGWHAALSRVEQGDRVLDLFELVPVASHPPPTPEGK